MNRTLQILFSVFGLIMLGIIGWRVYQDSWSIVNWGMLAVAALACLLVFRNFLYVFSYSYAVAAMGNALLIGWLLPSMAAWLLGAALFLFGLRMALFFGARQGSASYASRKLRVDEQNAKMPLGARIPLWILPSLLYAFHAMPLYVVARAGELSAAVLAGAAIVLAGTAIEGIADATKQRAKARDAERPVTHGIFRRWRHPNYAGEIVVQLGLLIAGLSAVGGVLDAVAVSLAPGYIIILMAAEARTLDEKQLARYGEDVAWRSYHAASGSLLPRP